MLPGMIYCARVNREVSTEFFIFSELRGKILYVYVYLGRLLWSAAMKSEEIDVCLLGLARIK